MTLVSRTPERLFSMPLRIGEESPLASKLPRFHRERFDIREAQLGNSDQGRFLAALPRERPTVISSRNLVGAFAAVSSEPLAVCWDGIDVGMRRAFASEGIPYIKDADNALLPFLGAVISSERPLPVPSRLSPQAQRMLFNLLSGLWEGCSAGQLAERTGKSNASVTKYLSEIEAIAPSFVVSEGKSRVLRLPGGITKREALEAFESYISSPVAKTHRIAAAVDFAALKKAGAKLSGESALAEFSDLARDPARTTVMMDADDVASLADAVGSAWREAQWYEEAPLVVEEWLYPVDAGSRADSHPCALDCVDSFSLYAEVSSLNTGDVRFEDAVEQLKEEICR
ncbi:MAG: hypothetical protein Q4C41_04685 [Eggerthellaceae bacterium]|nr:hypothetical protein [Eggerthellaceae bacterium]